MPQKPYLDTLDSTPETTATVLEWAKYLGRTFGGSQALNALRYYRDLNWISDDVHNELRSYIRGLSISELAGDEPVTSPDEIETLDDSPFAPHAQSLHYIADISGKNFNEEALQIEVAQERAEDEQFPFENASTETHTTQ